MLANEVAGVPQPYLDQLKTYVREGMYYKRMVPGVAVMDENM